MLETSQTNKDAKRVDDSRSGGARDIIVSFEGCAKDISPSLQTLSSIFHIARKVLPTKGFSGFTTPFFL